MSTVVSPTSAEPMGQQRAGVDIHQRRALAVNGWLAVVVAAGCIWGSVVAGRDGTGWLWLPVVAAVLVISTLVVVPPGQTSVVQFFGRYVGTVGRAGFWAVLPLTLKRRVSVRVRNFETGH